MKVTVKVIRGEGQWRSWGAIEVPCCWEMEQALKKDVVGVGDRDAYGGGKAPTTVNVYECDIYPEGEVYHSLPIRFCPFCGATVSVKVEDMEGGR